jgi:hypothetical protein
VVFYRSYDGLVVTAYVDGGIGHLVQLQSSRIAATFDRIVVVGNSIVFYNTGSGSLLIAYIDQAGHLVPTQNSQLAKNWYMLVELISYDPIDPG